MSDGSGQPGTPPEPDVGPAEPPAPPIRKPQSAIRNRHDRWAHRRGEPRIFVFAWTLFLFAATISTFVAAQAMGGGDRAVIRSAAQMLVLVGTIGVTLLWPMTRLCQLPEPHPVRGTSRDLVVMLVPVQAMLWPQAMWWLARWPLGVILAVDLVLIAWGVLAGGVLAFIQSLRVRAPERWGASRLTLAMLALTIVVAGGALVARPQPLTAPYAGDVTPPTFRASWMLSPLTAVLEITRERTWTGVPAFVTPSHFTALALTLLAGLPAWGVAASLRRGRGGPARLH